MKVLSALGAIVLQSEFAQMIGVSEARVSQMVSDGVIEKGATAHAWLLAYCERLRDQAAGRFGESGGLDLVQERAALAREQRIGQAIKNGVARKEFGPVGLLADVLGMASSAVVDRFDHLDGVLAKSCPNMPDEAKTAVLTVIADARNEWIKSTARLVDAAIDEMIADAADDKDVADA